MAVNPHTKKIDPFIKQTQKAMMPSKGMAAFGTVLELIKKYQDKYDTAAADLTDDFVVEKRIVENNIGRYNDALNLFEDINTNYGGNIDSYAQKKANDLYRQRTATQLGYNAQDGFSLYEEAPDAVLNSYTSSRAKQIATNIRNLQKTLGNINIGKIENPSEYVDETFNNKINQVPKNMKRDIFDIGGDLFTGKGFDLSQPDYASVRKQILDEVYSDTMNNTLGDAAEQFKILYTISPSLAKQFEDEIMPVTKGAKLVGSIDEKEEIVDDMGQERTVMFVTPKYQDVNGNFIFGKRRQANLSENQQQVGLLNFNKIFETFNDAGKRAYVDNKQGLSEYALLKNIMTNPEYLEDPTAAVIKQRLVLASDKLWADDMSSKGFGTIDPLTKAFKLNPRYQKLQDEGKQVINSEGERYLPQTQWLTKELKSVDTLLNPNVASTYDNTATKIYKNQRTGQKAYTFDGLRINESLDTLLNTKQNGKTFDEIIEEKLEVNTSLLDELKEEFDDKDYTRVDSNGNYFPYATPFTMFMTEEQQQTYGINSTIEFGYNVKNDQIVFREIYQAATVEKDTVEKDTVEKDTVEKDTVEEDTKGKRGNVIFPTQEERKIIELSNEEDVLNLMGLENNNENLSKVKDFINQFKNTKPGLLFAQRPFKEDIRDFIIDNVDDSILQRYNPDLLIDSPFAESGINQLQKMKAIDAMISDISKGLKF